MRVIKAHTQRVATTLSRSALAKAHASSVADQLMARLPDGDLRALDLLEDLVELDSHEDGAMGLVLDVRGPHVSLVLGRGRPHVEVWWGGVSATVEVPLSADAVDAFLRTWRR